MHRQHVQRSIKRLIQLGIILGGVKIGISRSYRLNPSFGWKGSAKGHRRLCTTREGYQVIRGAGRMGAAATLATCAHLQTTKQGYTELALCLVNQDPKTLKMSAYLHTVPLLRDPQGSCQHRGRCPHPRSPRGRGGENLLHPYHRSVGSPPTCKGQAASGCFASLDRFPAPSASDRFATLTEVERGQGRRSRAFYP